MNKFGLYVFNKHNEEVSQVWVNNRDYKVVEVYSVGVEVNNKGILQFIPLSALALEGYYIAKSARVNPESGMKRLRKLHAVTNKLTGVSELVPTKLLTTEKYSITEEYIRIAREDEERDIVYAKRKSISL